MFSRATKVLGNGSRRTGVAELTASHPSGARCNLFSIFLGAWEPWEVPDILENYGLIDEWENERIWAGLSRGADPERTLLDVVRRAYIDYGRSTASLH